MWQQGFVFAVLAVALALFAHGRWRYDFVGLSAMAILALVGILGMEDIFHGFANDAVLSVVGVMVVGRAVREAGATAPFARLLLRAPGRGSGQVLALTTTVGAFSGFMNNTGALAVFLPVAVHMAREMRRLASSLLMPLAFASLLGGLITLIGTPPNILVASFRQEHMGEAYGMFDFTPVGLGIAVAGILFLSLVGWRILPARRGSVSASQLVGTASYFAEVRVVAGSVLSGRPLRDLGELDVDVNVVGIVRGEHRIVAPLASELVHEGDILLVESAGPELRRFVRATGVELGADRRIAEEEIGSRDIVLQEVVIARGSPLVGRTPKGLRMRWRFGLNLLAISRQGSRIMRRIPHTRLRAGDVLLVQGRADGMEEVLEQLRCYTLTDEDEVVPSLPRLLLTVVIFGGAIGLVATGRIPLGLGFLVAALLLVVARVVNARQAYGAVDWPVVVLLGSTICLGTALEETGGAQRIAELLGLVAAELPPNLTVGAVMVGTMLLSNVVNNAATAVLMAPVAYALAGDMGLSPDTFLMAVAVGASACFLTPIGHQCNTLVLGPGGYRFSDYARLGVWLSAIVVVVGLPLLLWAWPLDATP